MQRKQAADMKKRLHAGFTFAETLITVALLSIVFLAVSGGFVVFQRAYTSITRKANAQVMLSTAVMQVTNDLRNATVYYDSTNAFETSARGYAIQYDSTDTTQGIIVKPYVPNGGTTDLKSLPLLTSKTNTDKMYTTLKWDDKNPFVRSTVDNTGLFTVTINVMSSEGAIIESQSIEVRSNSAVTEVQ
jgi:type II secretory pathway component PulJ